MVQLAHERVLDANDHFRLLVFLDEPLLNVDMMRLVRHLHGHKSQEPSEQRDIFHFLLAHEPLSQLLMLFFFLQELISNEEIDLDLVRVLVGLIIFSESLSFELLQLLLEPQVLLLLASVQLSGKLLPLLLRVMQALALQLIMALVVREGALSLQEGHKQQEEASGREVLFTQDPLNSPKDQQEGGQFAESA